MSHPFPTVSTMANTTYIVAAYDCGQKYGGSEEGGWWYDAGHLIRIVRTFRSEQRAYSYAQRLNHRLRSREFGPNRGKREYTSVLSEGEIQAHIHENQAPAYFPERRPRYE